MPRKTPTSRCEVDPEPKVLELLRRVPEIKYTEIGAQAGCSPGRVSQIAAKHNLGRTAGRPAPQLLVDLINQLRRQGEHSAAKIAKLASEQLGRPVSRQQVWKKMQALNAPEKEPS